MIDSNKCLAHRGYLGSVEYCAESDVLYGKLLGILSLILYEGRSLDELIADFQDAIDEYLSDCEEDGREPNKPSYETDFQLRSDKSNRLYHRGIYGSVEYCAESHLLHGKLLGIPHLLAMYDGKTLDELVADFKEAVDFHLYN